MLGTLLYGCREPSLRTAPGPRPQSRDVVLSEGLAPPTLTGAAGQWHRCPALNNTIAVEFAPSGQLRSATPAGLVEWRVLSLDGMSEVGSLALCLPGTLAINTPEGVFFRQEHEWQQLRAGPAAAPVTALAATPDGAIWTAVGDPGSTVRPGALSHLVGGGWTYYSDISSELPSAVQHLT